MTLLFSELMKMCRNSVIPFRCQYKNHAQVSKQGHKTDFPKEQKTQIATFSLSLSYKILRLPSTSPWSYSSNRILRIRGGVWSSSIAIRMSPAKGRDLWPLFSSRWPGHWLPWNNSLEVGSVQFCLLRPKGRNPIRSAFWLYLPIRLTYCLKHWPYTSRWSTEDTYSRRFYMQFQFSSFVNHQMRRKITDIYM